LKNTVLIVGASGFIGSYVYRKLSQDKNLKIIGTYCNSFHKDLIKIDYLNDSFTKDIIKLNPDIIIWLAGEKNLAETEIDFNNTKSVICNPILSFATNNKLNSRARFIYLSSDYVFDGEKGDYSVGDKTEPVSFYGKAKLISERYITNNIRDYHIIRAGGIIGKDSTFSNWLINTLKKEKEVELFDNFFSPTPIENVFNLIKDLIYQKFNDKLIHVSGYKKVSRFGLGVHVAKIMNSKTKITKKDYRESKLKLFKDLSLTSSYESKKNIDLIRSIENQLV
tara:strand:- start:3605 stop:4444 length:840 start_codon:yes stop_codon:yes gene_type:complete